MATGIVVRPDPAAANTVDDAVSQAAGAFHRGVRQVWLGQRFDVDALTLAAVIAHAVPGLGVGTAIVPINPRHPLLVASAAQTAQAAARGNFSLGISLGGYYAPRGAAYEHRITACAAWGGVYDYGAVWQHRWETSSQTTSVPFWQLPWVMGTDTMEQALNRVNEWTLADAVPHLTQPLLIVHGEHDQAIPLQDARRAHAAAGSVDKQLRIFTQAEGGSEHCNADDPDPARQLITDWFADRLGTIPKRLRPTAIAGKS